LFGLQTPARSGLCAQTGHSIGRSDSPSSTSQQESRGKRSSSKHTDLANRLIAARQTKRVEDKLVATGATKLDGDLILSERTAFP